MAPYSSSMEVSFCLVVDLALTIVVAGASVDVEDAYAGLEARGIGGCLGIIRALALLLLT